MIVSHGPEARQYGPRARVEQFHATLTHRHSDGIDERIRALLGDEQQWQLVARLATYDRAHHLKVHDLLLSRGHTDVDLLRAALLHDVGKSNGYQRVRLWHRVARVLGRNLPSRMWNALSTRGSKVSGGLFLAEHHAWLGAFSVEAVGGSARCCELIRRHEESPPTGDSLLDALIAADEDA